MGIICPPFLRYWLTVDIESFWTVGYAGHILNSSHELAIYVLWLHIVKLCWHNFTLSSCFMIFFSLLKEFLIKIFPTEAIDYPKKNAHKKGKLPHSKNFGKKNPNVFSLGSIHIWRQMVFGYFWPTYPNHRILYYISLFK